MKRVITIIVTGLMLLGLCGCSKKYNVDYQGNKDAFINAKNSYKVGEQVKLKVYLATDTDYSFSVEGVSVDQNVEDRGSILVFSFTMPEHDIVVNYSHRNSMINSFFSDYVFSFRYSKEPLANIYDIDFYKANIVIDDSVYVKLFNNDGCNCYSGPFSYEAYEKIENIIKENDFEKLKEVSSDRDVSYLTMSYVKEDGTYVNLNGSNIESDEDLKPFEEIARIIQEELKEGDRENQ